jgi:hypothetical protein
MAINDRTRTRENVVAILKRKPPIIRRKIVGWKAWYDDGRVFSSSKDKWQDLPSVGLTVLKKFYYQYKSDNDDDGFVKDAHGKEHLKIERQSGPDVY